MYQRLGMPLSFYDEAHRATHFQSFAQAESSKALAGEADVAEAAAPEEDVGADVEDQFAD